MFLRQSVIPKVNMITFAKWSVIELPSRESDLENILKDENAEVQKNLKDIMAGFFEVNFEW